MVSPKKMVPRVNPDDFYEFHVDDLVVYVQKSFVDIQAEIEFLIPYYAKKKIIVHK